MLSPLPQLPEVLGTGHSDDQGTQREKQADADTGHEQQSGSLGVGCKKKATCEGVKGLIWDHGFEDLPSFLSEEAWRQAHVVKSVFITVDQDQNGEHTFKT